MSEPIRTDPRDEAGPVPPVVVKKYANRRLYNTESSSYITLDNLAEMIRHGRDFVVYDAKTGEDITRSVLTQIIVEEEGKGRAMLPTSFLRHLIGFYGDNLQSIVPRYLEQAMTAFTDQQKHVREAMQQTMGRIFPFGNMEEVSRQNIAMMERAMTLWSPFYRPPGEGAPTGPSASEHDPVALEVAALRAEVEALRGQLAVAKATAAAPTPLRSVNTPKTRPAPDANTKT